MTADAPAPGPAVPDWEALVDLLTGGGPDDPPVSGTVRADGVPDFEFAWVDSGDGAGPFVVHPRPGHRPAGDGLTGDGPVGDGPVTVRVRRAGRRLRIDDAGGSPLLIVDGPDAWTFGDDDGVPVADRTDRLVFDPVTDLARRSPPSAWGRDDETDTLVERTAAGPVTATTWLGRPAWTVAVELGDTREHVVVDAETGTLLQRRGADGWSAGWTTFGVGVESGADTFRWDGPTRSMAELTDEVAAEEEELRAELAARFAREVTDQQLRLTTRPAVAVHRFDDDGSFVASLGDWLGVLERRPVGPGGRPGESGDADARTEVHRWSDERWDWTLTTHTATVDDDSLADLQRQLGSRPR